jgi:phosphoribosylformylglycinamidine cyclo-ligase
MKLKPTSKLDGLKGTIGEELMKVHLSYGPAVQNLIKRFNPGAARNIRALAHITGGGFVDNIPRVLPKDCDVVIHKGSWDMLPVFQILQEKGGVPEEELYQVFNMGIGMIVIVNPGKVESVQRSLKTSGHKSWVIGEVSRGHGIVRVI